MKILFTAFAFLVLPYAAHAQAIINMPRLVSETAEVTYTNFEDFSKFAGHYRVTANTVGGQDYGILMCNAGSMKARVELDGEYKPGYFAFDDSATCDTIAAAMEEKPGRRVKFTFQTDPAKHNAVPGFEGGRITQVEWLN